jgi:hypothetical protein
MGAFKITKLEYDAPLSDKKPSTLIKRKSRSIFGKAKSKDLHKQLDEIALCVNLFENN